MVGEARRTAIRKFYRMARTAVDKTQLEIGALARLDAGRYWKIENGVVFPSDEERSRLAKVLKVTDDDLPAESSPQASDLSTPAPPRKSSPEPSDLTVDAVRSGR